MMKSNRIAVLVFVVLILGAAVTLAAATQPKFRSSDSGAGRYLVTLAADEAEYLAATKGELVALYGARLDPGPPVGIRQFVVTMTAARARLLSSDPRVSEVAETPAVQPDAPVSSHRFIPQTTGYGDNGQSGTYTYDSSGNITAIGADAYLYDVEGRLKVSVTRGVKEDYTYDAFGNRRTATGATNCLGQTTCAQPVVVDTPTNRLQTINNNVIQYDAAGSITDIPGLPITHYVYDGTSMMTEATVASDDRQFVYTADDQRIAVKQGASWTWTVRDLNAKVLREFTSVETGGANFAMTTRVWAKDYVWRDSLLLATTSPNGTLHYHLDHLGTPRLITDANRVKVAEHAYYPFGAEINLTPHESPEEAMKFTGHERDIVVGDGHTLDYMHARYGNASLGRLISFDPASRSIDVANLQSWNRYAYALSNPLNCIDPTGAIVEYADSASKRAYEDYTANLDHDSEDYQNAQQLQKSDITYVIKITRIEGAQEGEVTTDGSKVFLNLAPGGPQANFSMTGRLAHEIEHGVQVDNGMVGFRKMEGSWHTTFTDVTDEVLAWNAQLRQSPAQDYFTPGGLRDYKNAQDKADYLILHGYPQYQGKKAEINNAPHVGGVEPGSVFRTETWFYRIPK